MKKICRMTLPEESRKHLVQDVAFSDEKESLAMRRGGLSRSLEMRIAENKIFKARFSNFFASQTSQKRHISTLNNYYLKSESYKMKSLKKFAIFLMLLLFVLSSIWCGETLATAQLKVVLTIPDKPITEETEDGAYGNYEISHDGNVMYITAST